jgi:hypothetical protein
LRAAIAYSFIRIGSIAHCTHGLIAKFARDNIALIALPLTNDVIVAAKLRVLVLYEPFARLVPLTAPFSCVGSSREQH